MTHTATDMAGNLILNASMTPEEEPLTKKQQEISKQEFGNKSFYQKLCIISSNTTVEPILTGLIIPFTIANLAIQNLNLDKACRINLNLEDKICDALINKETANGLYVEEEIAVQKVISGIEAWKSIIETTIPTVLVIFMGAWSDRTGNRKICIIIPILGELCVSFSYIACTYFLKEVSLEVTMFFEAFLRAVTGVWAMMFMGVFSYLSDITDENSRTFRVGLAFFCMTASIPIGTALSGILLKLWGYYAVFAISSLMCLLTLLYSYFRLKSDVRSRSDNNEKKKSTTFLEILELVKETGAVVFKERNGNKKTKILFILFLVAMINGPEQGEKKVLYLYTRYRLNWDAVIYSIYSTYSVITYSLSALFMVSVFSKRWGWHDSVLGLISVISKIFGCIVTASVQNDFHMYMVPLAQIFNATLWTSMRSMASKMVTNEDLGKMNSLLGLVDTLTGLVFVPMYSLVYRVTITWFAGTVFVFSACIAVIPIGFLIWFFLEHRKERRQRRIQDSAAQTVQKQREIITLSLVKESSDLVDSS